MDRFDDGRLYTVTWSDSVRGLADALFESRATVLEGIGTDEGWTFEIRFREQARIEAFQERVDECDSSLELGVSGAAITGRLCRGLTTVLSQTVMRGEQADRSE